MDSPRSQRCSSRRSYVRASISSVSHNISLPQEAQSVAMRVCLLWEVEGPGRRALSLPCARQTVPLIKLPPGEVAVGCPPWSSPCEAGVERDARCEWHPPGTCKQVVAQSGPSLSQSGDLKRDRRRILGRSLRPAPAHCLSHPGTCRGILWEEVIRPERKTYSAQCLRGPQWCSTAEAHFVSVCTVLLSVRRIVVGVHGDAVVDVAVTQLPFENWLLHLVCEHRHHSILVQSSRTDWSSFSNRSRMVLCPLFVALVKSVIGFALILCFFATNFTLNLICQFHVFKCSIFLFSTMMLFVSSLVGWFFCPSCGDNSSISFFFLEDCDT